ncbi:MAG: flagellar basal body rod protein FlgC [bacterium]
MPLLSNFNISGSALSAQSVRLNTVASNLANTHSVASSPDEVYKPRLPVFKTVEQTFQQHLEMAGVEVTGIVESTAEPFMEYHPDHPLADENGYIYKPAINEIEEMANMISASQSYSGNVEVMNTTKQLILQTLQLGQG